MKLLISACLAGKNCKYSGGNNRNEKVLQLMEDNETILICPEQMGGLPTPRTPAEIKDGVVTTKDERIVDAEFRAGAEKSLEIARREQPDLVVLQSRSPSCGVKQRYDGTFTGTLMNGSGVTAQLLMENGFRCLDVEDLVLIHEDILIRKLRADETDLLKDFLYEAIFIPEGVEPPARDIVERPELRLYYEEFGSGPADHCLVAEVIGRESDARGREAEAESRESDIRGHEAVAGSREAAADSGETDSRGNEANSRGREAAAGESKVQVIGREADARDPKPHVIGAVWTRLMNDYGHVDDDTPSFAISLYKEYRGRGIGTRLLKEMLALLKEEGHKQASLAVQKANYAVRMYEKAGFKIIDENDEEYIMVCEF